MSPLCRFFVIFKFYDLPACHIILPACHIILPACHITLPVLHTILPAFRTILLAFLIENIGMLAFYYLKTRKLHDAEETNN